MRRLGAKKSPFFRVVVIDSHSARDGRSVEVLGHYQPTANPAIFKLDRERFDHWLTKGAQPSDTVRTLLRKHPTGASADAEVSPVVPSVDAAAMPKAEAAAAPAEPTGDEVTSSADTDVSAESTPEEDASDETPSEEPRES